MILEANHISYTYRTQKNSPVLHQISAGFEAGKFYSIIGSSGSGKTTFLSLLAGLDTPNEGSSMTGRIFRNVVLISIADTIFLWYSKTIT